MDEDSRVVRKATLSPYDSQPRTKRKLRVPILICIGVVAALLVLAYRGNNAIALTSHTVTLARLPSRFDGLCIVQISDLHDHRFGPYQPRLLRYVRESHPDVIAITGDITEDGRLDMVAMRVLARQLVAVAPVYYVNGNHEAGSRDLPGLVAALEQEGITVLRNRSVSLRRGDQEIDIAGVDDPLVLAGRGEPFRKAFGRWLAELTRVKAALPTDRFSLLLSHRPEFIRLYDQLGFDLVLAGHAHGGQIRIPGIGAVYAPHQGLFPKYTEGVRLLGQTTEVISRGLGGSWFPVRVFNRPEIVVLRLRSPRL
jgi:uncharacterized protein